MSKMFYTLNDKAWMKLFDEYHIISEIEKHGIYDIKAKQINEYREARLMTKFDHRSNLPAIFAKNKLSILPISRGSYVIGKFETYHDLLTIESENIRFKLPDFIESIDCENITSESTAINVAYLSGILSDFTCEDNLLPTINGRMSSNKFQFTINSTVSNARQNIFVNNSQIEIDGGYEGNNSLVLIEAKNSISKDLLVRQLYYPFRLWNAKVNKSIKNIYLNYSNGNFFCMNISLKTQITIIH